MTKTELVAAISAKTDIAKTDVEKVLKAFEDEVSAVVSAGQEKLTLPGFLSFERTRRAARTGRNPQTGETIQVPASNAVKVTAGSKLKATAKASK
jgi:DNA-binding protein HU-beta